MKTTIFGSTPEEPMSDQEIDFTDDFEITSTFVAQYRGTCTIDREHEWRRGQRIGRVAHANNPMLPVQGYACADCTKLLPRSEIGTRRR